MKLARAWEKMRDFEHVSTWWVLNEFRTVRQKIALAVYHENRKKK